jgi:hypothetical protein
MKFAIISDIHFGAEKESKGDDQEIIPALRKIGGPVCCGRELGSQAGVCE